MAKQEITKEERERVRIAFFNAYKGQDGFRECSVRTAPNEGPYIHLGVADIWADWIWDLPDTFEGLPIWTEEVPRMVNATLPQDGPHA